MRDRLKLIGNFLKTFWWVLVLVLVVVFIGWLYLVKRGGKSSKEEDKTRDTVMGSVATKVKDAVTDVKVDRAVIKAETEMKRKELEEIRQEPDGKKRREKLAGVLSKSL